MRVDVKFSLLRKPGNREYTHGGETREKTEEK
jgi:hypothetical protein